MTEYEVDQTVERLYKIPSTKEPVFVRPGRTVPEEEAQEIVSVCMYKTQLSGSMLDVEFIIWLEFQGPDMQY